jgi:hypothetical protein
MEAPRACFSSCPDAEDGVGGLAGIKNDGIDATED